MYVSRDMFKFESCWKCEEPNKVRVLNIKLPIDICNRVCEYNKCDKCMKKMVEMADILMKTYTFKQAFSSLLQNELQLSFPCCHVQGGGLDMMGFLSSKNLST